MSISVEVRGDVEKALRLFKKKILMEGILKELRRRRYHEKPSVKKKRKQIEAQRRKHKEKKRLSFYK